MCFWLVSRHQCSIPGIKSELHMALGMRLDPIWEVYLVDAELCFILMILLQEGKLSIGGGGGNYHIHNILSVFVCCLVHDRYLYSY